MTYQATAASGQRSHEDARALFERIYGLLNEHELRHIPSVFTDDVVYEDDAWPVVVRGREEMEDFVTVLWAAVPDLRFELLEGPYLSEDGSHAATRVRISGTFTGASYPPGFAATGSPLATEYGGFYELEAGRVKRGRIILDMNDLASQVGAAPRSGSNLERMAAKGQHLTARVMRRRARRWLRRSTTGSGSTTTA